jgi:hypothetical protein
VDFNARFRDIYSAMPFDPSNIEEDHCGEGHLDEVPLHAVLLSVLEKKATGRLTIRGERGENHVFFMQGSPVGVQLSTPFCPLGQLLLELRKVDSGSYMRAQKSIVQQQRMPGQVFIEMGAVDEEGLQEILAVQARRRFERFAILRARPFRFCRGISFLSGFQRAALDVHVLLYLAQKGQLPPAILNEWLEPLLELEVRIADGQDALPTTLQAYGFGPPEQRFLERLRLGWQGVADLIETGTLPREQMALMLYHLDKLSRLERRVPPPPEPVEITPPPQEAPPVFADPPPQAAPVPAAVDDVFANTPSDPHAAFPGGEPFAPGLTDPNLKRDDIHDVPTVLPAQPKPVSVPNTPSPTPPAASTSPAAAPASPTPVRLRFPSEDTLKQPPKKKKKKRTRRNVPEPSQGSSAVSRTKKEKTTVGELPSIVIEGLDDDG